MEQLGGNSKIFWYHNLEGNKLIKKPRPTETFVFKLSQRFKLNKTIICIMLNEQIMEEIKPSQPRVTANLLLFMLKFERQEFFPLVLNRL